MTEREMFEKSFDRPKNYWALTPQAQWDIDSSLGILDWKGEGLDENDLARFCIFYVDGNNFDTPKNKD